MSHRLHEISQSFVEQSASLLDVMANERRLQVLSVLSEGEMSVGALSAMIGLSQSALSQHLSKLRTAGLVTTRRDAQTIFYSCSSDAVQKILGTLSTFFDEADVDDRKRA